MKFRVLEKYCKANYFIEFLKSNRDSVKTNFFYFVNQIYKNYFSKNEWRSLDNY